MRMISKVARAMYKQQLKQKGLLSYAKQCNISRSSSFAGKNTMLSRNIIDHCSFGYGSFIGSDCVFVNTRIGKYCSIGDHVRTVIGNHPSHTFVSTNPTFYSLNEVIGKPYVKTQKFDDVTYADAEKRICVHVGHDVWIGDGVLLLNGIRIGDGAIIAAGSFVNKDVEAYTIYGGVPAKKIKNRFHEEEIAFLKEFRWFDKSIAELKVMADDFENIKTFMEKYK